MFTKTKTALSVAMVLAAVGTASLAWAGGQNDGDSGLGGFVSPGSTVGVNPAYHQDEFGSAANLWLRRIAEPEASSFARPPLGDPRIKCGHESPGGASPGILCVSDCSAN